MDEFLPTTRVAAYIRVSTQEQAQFGLSIEAQTAALNSWVQKHGLRIINYYVDAGISARKPALRRPALQQLLTDIQAGKIDLIIFTKLDRWFRSVSEYYKVQDILDKHKVNWKTIHEDYETTTASGRLKINILLSVAQDEADRTSERIKRVFELKRAKGEPVSGHVPTGYKIEGKAVVKDPELEEAVTAFFQRYLEIGSISDAIDFVADRYGLRWKYQLASAMLSKPAYWGDFNGVECPPYITRDQAERIAASRRRTARKTKTDRVYLFSGLLVCGECGARMGGRTHKIGGVEKAEYNCPGHYQKKGCGNRTNIRESAIEAFLLDTIEHRFQAYRSLSFEAKRTKTVNRRAEIARLKRRLSKLKELYLNDLLTLEEYRADFQPLTEKIEALEAAQKEQQRPNLKAMDSVLFKGWREAYNDLEKLERKTFWRMLLAEIRVYPDRHVEYNFL